jgi:hypothetical protein
VLADLLVCMPEDIFPGSQGYLPGTLRPPTRGKLLLP